MDELREMLDHYAIEKILKRYARALDEKDYDALDACFTPDAVLEIQMIRIIIEPGGRSADIAYNNPRGAKCGTVTSGQLGLEVAGREYILGEGDSFAFKAEDMHRFWCVGDLPVALFWVVTPALY